MTNKGPTGLYDRFFCRWLDQRLNQAPCRLAGGRVLAPRETLRIDLTALVRDDFEPRMLANLQALGLAR